MDADDGNRLEDTKLTVEEIYQGLVHAASISNATDDSQVAEAERPRRVTARKNDYAETDAPPRISRTTNKRLPGKPNRVEKKKAVPRKGGNRKASTANASQSEPTMGGPSNVQVVIPPRTMEGQLSSQPLVPKATMGGPSNLHGARGVFAQDFEKKNARSRRKGSRKASTTTALQSGATMGGPSNLHQPQFGTASNPGRPNLTAATASGMTAPQTAAPRIGVQWGGVDWDPWKSGSPSGRRPSERELLGEGNLTPGRVTSSLPPAPSPNEGEASNTTNRSVPDSWHFERETGIYPPTPGAGGFAPPTPEVASSTSRVQASNTNVQSPSIPVTPDARSRLQEAILNGTPPPPPPPFDYLMPEEDYFTEAANAIEAATAEMAREPSMEAELTRREASGEQNYRYPNFPVGLLPDLPGPPPPFVPSSPIENTRLNQTLIRVPDTPSHLQDPMYNTRRQSPDRRDFEELPSSVAALTRDDDLFGLSEHLSGEEE